MSNTVTVSCRNENKLYNAYNLVKAFYPYADVQGVSCEDQPAQILVHVPGSHDIEADDIRSLYCLLRDACKKDLPWGMLTGVRPVKLAFGWIDRNMQDFESAKAAKEAFSDWFYEDRFVSSPKARLAFEIALREREVLERTFGTQAHPEGRSIYISIPFCPSVCSYCSFSSGSIASYGSRADDYLDALICEMKSAGTMISPSSVYIGGGTPTSLDERQLEKLLSGIDEIFRVREGLDKGTVKEYTVEAGRPDSITAGKLEAIRKYGATRISINPQTMQQKTLDAVGRKHTAGQIRQAFHMARDMGFDNINMDLIMGLPGETNDDVRDTLEQIREMAPDSLTVHCLALKRASYMGMEAKTKTHRAADPASGDISLMISDAYNTALQMGLVPYYLYRQKNISGNYENIGYARPGMEGLYNILMMEEVQSITAFGAGASSREVLEKPVPNPGRRGQMTRILRRENPKNVDEYITRNLNCSELPLF